MVWDKTKQEEAIKALKHPNLGKTIVEGMCFTADLEDVYGTYILDNGQYLRVHRFTPE